MTNRASRRATRATAGRRAPGRRRSTIPALLVLLAIFALVLLAVASFQAGVTAPSPTP